jgi:FtsZ-binding cell division protein ZapB
MFSDAVFVYAGCMPYFYPMLALCF